MRFKKGTNVEVLSTKEGPSGSWRLAEIIGGNSHHYSVRYEGGVELFGKGMSERVSCKVIRPCPPPVELLGDYREGDVVEVLRNFSWKMATVLKVSGRNHLFVRIFGSGVEFRACKYEVRVRLCWQDDEWIVVGEASNKCENLRFKMPSSRTNNSEQWNLNNFVNERTKCDNEFNRHTNVVRESQATPSKTLKRKVTHVHSKVEAVRRPTAKKIRFGNRENFRNQFNSMHQSQLPGKVENIASSQQMMYESCMHPSYVNKINGCSEMNMGREITDEDDDVSVSSSVASCSVYRNSSRKLHHVFPTNQYEDNDKDSQSSDAESCFPLRSKEGNPIPPSKEALADEIHRLELHAYRCTIGALYELGPLSWEQELLLTNLRDSLHISIDEHLVEIKKLVSPSICIPSR